MYTTLAEVGVADLPTFIATFATRGAQMRGKHGSRSAAIWQAADDRARIYILIDWESREHFERFVDDPEVPPTMRSGSITAPPRFTPIVRVAEFPA